MPVKLTLRLLKIEVATGTVLDTYQQFLDDSLSVLAETFDDYLDATAISFIQGAGPGDEIQVVTLARWEA